MGRAHCSPGSQKSGSHSWLLLVCFVTCESAPAVFVLPVFSMAIYSAESMPLASVGDLGSGCSGKKNCSWLSSQSLIFANQIVAEINLPEDYFPLLKMTL